MAPSCDVLHTATAIETDELILNVMGTSLLISASVKTNKFCLSRIVLSNMRLLLLNDIVYFIYFLEFVTFLQRFLLINICYRLIKSFINTNNK